MQKTTSVKVPVPIETTRRTLCQIGEVMNWRAVRKETRRIVWRYDRGTSVLATMEPCDQGTMVTLTVDRSGAFDPFREQRSILRPLVVRLTERTNACFLAHAEIVRLLSEAGSEKWVSRKEVERIAQRHMIDLDDELRPQMALLYRKHLSMYTTGGQLCDEHRITLSHLQHILHLDEETINQIHTSVNTPNLT